MLDLTEEQWNNLFDKMETEIQSLISELPEEIKPEAEKILCLLDKYSPRGQILGMYDPNSGEGPIWIFVGAIYEACAQNLEETIISVRQVYLHEFAHHFGLKEYEVEKLGL